MNSEAYLAKSATHVSRIQNVIIEAASDEFRHQHGTRPVFKRFQSHICTLHDFDNYMVTHILKQKISLCISRFNNSIKYNKMATLTSVDLLNASKYAVNQHRLKFIPKWRARFPNILIDYELRVANDDDYYVSPIIAPRAIVTKLTFSERGCASMSCYPFHETGPIENITPFGYTQTSETAQAYAQPACYNLDRALAMQKDNENEVQSVELRYAANKCILVDSLSKMYMNSPYLRTDEHLIQGVDDVPAFNVRQDDNGLFPERFIGEFNQAYCHRFGRTLMNGGCSMQWWESLIGFVLGDTIYVTFKLLANNVFSQLREYDYRRPSPLLPPKPETDSNKILEEWRNVRDSTPDVTFETLFAEYETLRELGIDNDTKIIYRADNGYTTSRLLRSVTYKFRTPVSATRNDTLDDETLDHIISQFLEDHALVFGILTDIGFDMLLTQFKTLLKQINSSLIPALRRLLLTTSRRVTARMLGETYKAALVHTFNRLALKTISVMAKALTRMLILASSVIGIVLILLTLSDLVLALWDPFGYNNMFPREFPIDMSDAFLTSYFESMGESSRDMVEFLPEFFSDMVESDEEIMADTLGDILDYVAALEINSNGQMLQLNEGEKIVDFDELSLVGAALASSSLYTRLDFLQHTARHNAILEQSSTHVTSNYVMSFLLFVGGFIILCMRNDNYIMTSLFVIMLLLALYLLVKNSMSYFIQMQAHVGQDETQWWRNLYTGI